MFGVPGRKRFWTRKNAGGKSPVRGSSGMFDQHASAFFRVPKTILLDVARISGAGRLAL
jgi:hypothetical protein